MPETIQLINAHENNLKNISLEIPKNKITILQVFLVQESHQLYLIRSHKSQVVK
ncbi:Uncharacterised protein [Weissella viridescens]|uniref:Uncharacterized protein n=1 Tax=Weissella viridescens TaxID=1629 RepID=A0A380NY40_WEIVI|nr:Uncharacterised protein [Weissella viridescens]